MKSLEVEDRDMGMVVVGVRVVRVVAVVDDMLLYVGLKAVEAVDEGMLVRFGLDAILVEAGFEAENLPYL